MEKKQFKTVLNTTPEKLWDLLWNDETYPQWTEPFSPGSRALSDWQKGSKVHFVDGKGSGMLARIEATDRPRFISFQHIGMVKDGQEDTQSEEVKKWSGIYENYTLTPVDGGTELTVDMDMTPEMKDYMEDTWPKAFDQLHEMVGR